MTARLDSPREAALRLLEALFGEGPGGSRKMYMESSAASPTLSLTDFQAEGVARVRAILRRRGGAVLADSVGLGKTFVALALVEETLRAGGEAVVVVPASLRSLWRQGLRRLPLGGGRWMLISHAQLARGAQGSHCKGKPAPEGPGAGRLLVVDEAHRFRNPATLRYAALARLASPATAVLLVTATPVNNSPGDLLHLLRLFSRDDGFRDVGVPSLRDTFGRSGRGDPPWGAESARVSAVIQAVVVRRTRAMLRSRFDPHSALYAAAGTRFPGRAPVRLIRYPDPDLPSLVEGLADLELRVHAPHRPEAEGSTGAVALIRLNLLKRLDSSPAAFQASVARLESLLSTALDAARAGRLLTPASMPGGRSGGRSDGDPLQLMLIDLVADPASPALDLLDLTRSLERDLARVGQLARLRRRGENAGAKQRSLVELLERTRGEKTLVFTEYRDTACSLWLALRGRFPTARVDGSGAWLGSRPAGRRMAVDRFAPAANGLAPPPDRERVDVLVATDVLAEGLNLQDARHVISYDLPWNPVRLLQRIGRVDRLGSPHREIVPYLFTPDAGIEAVLGLTRRIRRKLGHIATTVGAEHGDELLRWLGGTGGGSPYSMEESDEPDDPVERLRTLWVRNRERRPPAAAPDSRLATRADTRPGLAGCFYSAAVGVPPKHPAAALAWIVVADVGGIRWLLEIDKHGSVAEAGHAAVECLGFAVSTDAASECKSPPSQIRTQAEPPSQAPGVENVPLRPVVGHLRETVLSVRHAPAWLSHSDPARRLARRIREAVAAEGSIVDRELIGRADELLRHLAAPLPRAAETRVRALLRSPAGAPLITLLEAGEAALTGLIRGRASGSADARMSDKITLLAALRILPAELPESG